MKKILYFILLLPCHPASGSDFNLPTGFREVYEQVFSLEITKVKSGIASLSLRGPFRIYPENYVEFTERLNSHSEAGFDRASSHESARLAAIENLVPGSPFAPPGLSISAGTLAKAYFGKALSYKTCELKSTIDIKARAALAQLK